MTAVTRKRVSTKLVVGVIGLTLVVMGLGAAVVSVKLRTGSAQTDTKQAEVDRLKAVVLANPKDDNAEAGLGLALEDAGRLDEARSAFEEALRLNPKSWVALIQLGLLVRDGDPSRAEDLLSKGAAAAPPTEKPVAFIALGDLLMKRGDAAGAKKAYENAIGYAPYIVNGHVGLARALEALGDKRGALQHYEEAARFAPDDQDIARAIARLQSR